jgi:uncharacterized protein (DUF1697 family)
MTRHVALLRAINVGGRNKVPMARLRELMGELGYEDVATYVQSGNVVFSGPKRPDTKVAAALERAYKTEFGFEIGVVVRTRDELAAIVKANPLGAIATDPARQLVYFLADRIHPQRLEDIDRDAVAPDVFELHGRELHMWAPNGSGRSKLAALLTPKRLRTTATARNWRTVEKLLELADADRP